MAKSTSTSAESLALQLRCGEPLCRDLGDAAFVVKKFGESTGSGTRVRRVDTSEHHWQWQGTKTSADAPWQ